MMIPAKIFPTILIVLDVLAALMYRMLPASQKISTGLTSEAEAGPAPAFLFTIRQKPPSTIKTTNKPPTYPQNFPKTSPKLPSRTRTPEKTGFMLPSKQQQI
jgi:hypothetical protein